jgi:D-alanyl-D-alanine carboxypeptidase
MWNWRPLLCLFAVTIAISLPRGKRTTEQAALAALDAELSRKTADDTFSGTVLIAKDGASIFERAHNRADRERGVPNEMDTSFNIGSITKMYTAVVVLHLVQDGKLALTDTVGKWIPDYPNRAIADHVTIHHLLTHTGGVGDIFDEDYPSYRLSLRSHDDYVKKFGAREPRFAAGKGWEYANYGFVLAGVIIERVTGMTYYDAVAKYVFEPAGMKHSSFPRYDEVVGAIGYTLWSGEPLRHNKDMLLYRGVSAGCAWSSSRDLLAFANALTSGKLLDQERTQLILNPMVRTRLGFRYGDNHYTIAAVANFDPPVGDSMSHFVAQRLPAK